MRDAHLSTSYAMRSWRSVSRASITTLPLHLISATWVVSSHDKAHLPRMLAALKVAVTVWVTWL